MVKNDEILNGVGCTVKECQYNNKENKCTAEQIIVNHNHEHSKRETDTFCDTFVAED